MDQFLSDDSIGLKWWNSILPDHDEPLVDFDENVIGNSFDKKTAIERIKKYPRDAKKVLDKCVANAKPPQAEIFHKTIHSVFVAPPGPVIVMKSKETSENTWESCFVQKVNGSYK